MTWHINRNAAGLPTSMSWSGHYGVVRAYDRHQLAAIREAERTIIAAWPDREPTAAQVAELCGLREGEVRTIWEQVGREWKA